MPGKVLTEYRHDGQVALVTLNAPKGNVLDAEMMAELQAAFDQFASQPQLKLLQFTGAGEHFCFGASVEEHTREKAPNMLSQFHGLFYRLIDLAVPTMALVSGQCLGGGMELALMCNVILVDRTAKLGQPEIMLGVFAPPASLILPLKIGQARADDLLLTGRSIKAEEAVAIGLATEVFDTPEKLHKSADQWFERHLMPKSASSLRFAVRAARSHFNRILRDRLKELERMYVDELMATNDANEGIASFLERRRPKWQSK